MGVLLYVMCFFSLPAFKIFFLFFNILLWWYWVWSLWVYLELIEFLGCVKFFFYQIWEILEFPGGPVFRTLWFHCWGPGLILGQGTKILWAVQAVWPKKRKKKKEKIRRKYINFISDFWIWNGFWTVLCLPRDFFIFLFMALVCNSYGLP